MRMKTHADRHDPPSSRVAHGCDDCLSQHLAGLNDRASPIGAGDACVVAPLAVADVDDVDQVGRISPVRKAFARRSARIFTVRGVDQLKPQALVVQSQITVQFTFALRQLVGGVALIAEQFDVDIGAREPQHGRPPNFVNSQRGDGIGDRSGI